MTPHVSSSLAVNSKDWACWLKSIAQSPHQHHQLIQIGNTIDYISRDAKWQLWKSGQHVYSLRFNQILAITRQLLENTRVEKSDRDAMLQGVRYLHQQRQMRYQQLFWLVRWFAYFRGVKATLKAEAETIEQFLSLDSHAINQEKRCAKLRDQFVRLSSQKKHLNATEKVQWYEQFFALERKWYTLRMDLPKELRADMKAFESNFEEWNAGMPRVARIAKAFCMQALKQDLRTTLDGLCQHISAIEKKRDKKIFRCSQIEVLGLLAKRLVRAKNTQFSFAFLTEMERTSKIFGETLKEGMTKTIQGMRVIFLPQDHEVYIKEGYIKQGSYKAVFVGTPGHALEKMADRCSLAILQPLEAVENEIEQEQTILEQAVQSSQKIKALARLSLKAAKKALKTAPVHAQAAGSNSQDLSFTVEGGQKQADGYQKEAHHCLLYGHLPGIWRTYKVRRVDKQMTIFQPLAGYSLKTVSNEARIAICLGDMAIFFRNHHLQKQDMLVFLKMIHDFLVGVSSLHQAGIIHRDIKTENILCSREGKAAVSDLGTLCADKIYQKKLGNEVADEWVPNPEKNVMVGSPLYISPEMVHDNLTGDGSRIDFATDIWSVGLVLWECLSGQPLLKHHVFDRMRNAQSSALIVMKIGELLTKDHYLYHFFYPEPKETTSLAHLIWRCTRPEPAKRPHIETILKDYQAWATYVEKKMRIGAIQFPYECFEDRIL